MTRSKTPTPFDENAHVQCGVDIHQPIGVEEQATPADDNYDNFYGFICPEDYDLYSFECVHPSCRATIRLSGTYTLDLPADYDLTLFSDPANQGDDLLVESIQPGLVNENIIKIVPEEKYYVMVYSENWEMNPIILIIINNYTNNCS